MPGTTQASVLIAIRNRTGDLNSPYFLTDTQWNTFIDSAEVKLKKYIRKASFITVTGDNTNTITLTSALQTGRWTSIMIRDNDDVTTDRPLKGYRLHGDTIYSRFPISTTQKVVFTAKTGYVLDTDTFTDDALELLYLILELEFIKYASFRRADFEQWASTNRSDASINQLMILAQQLRTELAKAEIDLGDSLEVSELSHYD